MRWYRLFMLAAAAALGTIPGTASAQPSAPPGLSPIAIQSDANGVNLATGRMVIEGPALSVPAAPNLRFDRVQNAAPYATGKFSGGPNPPSNWTVQTGGGASVPFHCLANYCETGTGSGSTFLYDSSADPNIPDVPEFRQGGSGARYYFDVPFYNVPGNVFYYASRVVWPSGETISYTYETASLSGLPAYRYRRPTRIASNLGYHIDLTYPVAGDPGVTGWGTPSSATLYRTAEPTVPLRRLTYNGGTVTDSGSTISDPSDDRTYSCTSCGGTMGNNVEINAGTLQLPGESSPAVQAVAGSQPNNALVQTVTRDGVPWTYSYANQHQPAGTLTWLYDSVTVTGPNGFNQVYQMTTGGAGFYSNFNLVTGVTDSLSRTTSYTVDASTGQVLGVTYPEGNAVSVTYDDAGNIIARTMQAKPGSGTSPATITESAHYTLPINPPSCDTACWRPNWRRDGLNRQTDYSYNAGGQVTEQLDPADANGVRRRTSILYAPSASGISRPSEVRICADTGVSCAATAPVRTQYQYLGDTGLPTLERRIDSAGTQLDTVTSYDSEGRPLSTDGPLAGTDDTSYFRYDVYGRKTWEIGAVTPNGVRLATRFTYRNSDDKPVIAETGTIPNADSTVLTVSRRTDLAYDGRRNAIREAVSGSGTTYSVTDRAFDNRNLPICQTQRMNQAHFPLNGAGGALPADACTADTGGAGDRITTTAYDAAGQRLQVREGVGTAAEGSEATWAYGLNGQTTTVIDGNGNRATLHYDGHMRQDRWTFPSTTRPSAFNDSTPANALSTAGSVNAADYEEYGYDATGNRTSVRKRDGSLLQYQYDNLNRMIVKIVPERPSGAQALTAAQTRDVYYGYDLRDAQLYARFDSASGEGITNTYDGFGRQTSSSTNMGGTTRTLGYGWDAAGNRASITHPDGTWFGSWHDALGQQYYMHVNGVAGIAFDYTNLDGTSGVLARVGIGTWYSYDGIQRVASMAHATGAPTDVSYAYTRNPAGQLASVTRTGDAYAWTGHYAVQRPYTTNGLNQYSAAGTASFTYDANGNLIADGTNTYVYDVENRLVGRTNGNVALSYDPLGRLYRVNSPTTDTRFLYDGNALVAEYDAAGTLLWRYAHWAGADVPVVAFQGSGIGTMRQLLPDHQGSIVAQADGNAAIVQVNTYDEYGIPGAGNQGRFQYTGQIWLPEIGMYHYKARVYSPTLGRFLQTDPVGYADQFNLYSYVGNDPVNSVDPDGQACVALNSASPYCHRASSYRLFDEVLRGRTRFFAAAARTVEFLANTDYPIAGGFFVSASTRSLLSGISARLERANESVALLVATGRWGGAGLNARLVHYEQGIVQAGLNAYAQANPQGYANAISEINGLLNAGGLTRAAANLFPSDASYMRVLGRVRGTLRRDIDFARQTDREAIGNALIDDARRSGACDRTGTRIKSC